MQKENFKYIIKFPIIHKENFKYIIKFPTIHKENCNYMIKYARWIHYIHQDNYLLSLIVSVHVDVN